MCFKPFMGMTVSVSVMEPSLAASALASVIVLVIFVALEVLLLPSLLSHTIFHRRGTDARCDAVDI